MNARSTGKEPATSKPRRREGAKFLSLAVTATKVNLSAVTLQRYTASRVRHGAQLILDAVTTQKILVVVQSDEDRIGIYSALNEHPATKVVI
ncbi:MAG: hypothetical protein HY961_09095 [Ignavibacteriae bacterium]|nr:hypothetical protein [Ignavibacteriota bacterium]